MRPSTSPRTGSRFGIFAVPFQSQATFEAAAARVKNRQVFQDPAARTLVAVTNYGGSACAAALESHARTVFRR